MSKSKESSLPDWSSQLTEQLISPLPPSAIIVHSPAERDEQFENYIDRTFTSNDAQVLKNRLSETPSKTTTLRNSSNTVPPNYWSDIKDLSAKLPPPNDAEKGIRPAAADNDDTSSQLVWWILSDDDHDGFYSVSALLFVCGFIFPPCWWLGAVWPRHIKERGGKMAERWQKLNRIMSIGFSTILIILIIVFVVLYTTGNM